MNILSIKRTVILVVIFIICVPVGYMGTSMVLELYGIVKRDSLEQIQKDFMERARQAYMEQTRADSLERARLCAIVQAFIDSIDSLDNVEKVAITPKVDNSHPDVQQPSVHNIGGYAEWTGCMKNGQPHGEGTMRFKTTHAIDSRHTAEAGDYIDDAEYEDGRLLYGRWHHHDGTTEQIEN